MSGIDIDSSCVDDKVPTTLHIVLFSGSVCIITLLSLLECRENAKRCRRHCTRLGLIYPVDLIGTDHNRLIYATAFGCSASFCFQIFNQQTILPGVPGWAKTFGIMGTVLLYGLFVYPLFACITTQWTVIGSLLGAGYTALWFVMTVYKMVECIKSDTEIDIGVYTAVQLPLLFCLLLMILWFSYVFFHRLFFIFSSTSKEHLLTVFRQDQTDRLAMANHRSYVKALLNGESADLSDADSIFQYKSDPTFKYSTRIIAVFTVAIICLYQFCILIVVWVQVLINASKDLLHSYNETVSNAGSLDDPLSLIGAFELFLEVCEISVLVAFILSVIFSLVTVVQILVNYRANIRRMYRGYFKHLPFERHERSATEIVSFSLAYAGSQIAFTLWGFLIPFVSLSLVGLLVAYLVVLPATGDVPWSLNYMLNILPSFAAIVVIRYIQLILARCLVQKEPMCTELGEKNVRVLALDNRKVYHNASFFLFFFYIVLGFFACILNIVKSIGLGIFYESRMDRSRLMTGYEAWDLGHMYYTSFLHLESTHRHPVLLVFCDLLTHRVSYKGAQKMRNYNTVAVDEARCQEYDHLAALPIPKRLSRLRWLKAYTLVRNHFLVRKNGDMD